MGVNSLGPLPPPILLIPSATQVERHDGCPSVPPAQAEIRQPVMVVVAHRGMVLADEIPRLFSVLPQRLLREVGIPTTKAGDSCKASWARISFAFVEFTAVVVDQLLENWLLPRRKEMH
jgi:hypothetical protein